MVCSFLINFKLQTFNDAGYCVLSQRLKFKTFISHFEIFRSFVSFYFMGQILNFGGGSVVEPVAVALYARLTLN